MFDGEEIDDFNSFSDFHHFEELPAQEFKIAVNEIVTESISRWENDVQFSKLIDAQLQNILGSYEDIQFKRFVEAVLDKIHWKHHGLVERMRSGSSAEGISLPGSDVDVMYWTNHHNIFQDREFLRQNRCTHFRNRKPNVLLMAKSQRCPGFVRLECLSPHTATVDVQFSLVNIDGKQFFSSRNFTQFHLTIAVQNERFESINGPCIRSTTALGSETDNAHCLKCHFWPDEAYEFITRERRHGWPPEPMLQQILSDGIHLVPIGSRSRTRAGTWEHDSLQWRYSFSKAELSLIHSFNAIQFRMYGFLKIILNELLKQRLPENTFCSYYMKTTMFWLIEETSQELWQEKNMILLLDMCLQRLMSYVRREYCPNFFLPYQNLYEGKIYGYGSCEVYEALTQMYRLGYRAFLTCNSMSYLQLFLRERMNHEEHYPPSIICTSVINVQEIDLPQRECKQDIQFYVLMQSINPQVPNLESILEKLRSAESMCYSAQYDPLTYDVARAQYLRHSCDTGLALCHSTKQERYMISNKMAKRKLDTSIYYLLQSLQGDISRGYLSIATVFYELGNPCKALGFLKAFRSRNKPHVLYIPRKVAYNTVPGRSSELYAEKMCGRNLSRQEKASEALSYGFEAYQTIPVIPKQLLPELLLVKDTAYILSVHPLAYSCFLSFLCYHELGNTRLANVSFYELLNSDLEIGTDIHMASIMAGICYLTLDDYNGALRSYMRAFHEKKRLADAFSYSGENQSWESPLFYIALLLKLII